MLRPGRLLVAALIAVCALTLALALSQGLSSAPGPTTVPTPAGVLRLSWDDPETLDPALAQDTRSHGVVLQLFSGLVRLDQQLAVEPALAASWQVSADGRTYTFTLREDARFQDGRPISASDVKYSLERAADPRLHSPTAATYLGDIVGVGEKLAGKADEIAGVRVRDERTLAITIDSPKVYFLAKLTYPTAAVVDRANVESGSDWTEHPNGSGPYRLISRDQDWLVLQRSQYAVGTAAAPREIRFYVGQRTAMQMYETKQLDVIEVGLGDLERALDPRGQLYDDLVVSPSMSLFYLGLDATSEPFRDRSVRRAFAEALDREKLVRVTLKGAVRLATGILPPGMPGYYLDSKSLPYDPEAARRELAASPYGGPPGLPPITVTGGLGDRFAEVYWGELAVPLEVQLVQQGFFQGLARHEYQMFVTGWVADYPDPENFLDLLLHSGSAGNHSGYSNPRVDSLLEQARGETDQQRRWATYREAESIALADAAIVPLYNDVDYRLVSPRVHGLEFTPLGLLSFDGATVD